MEEEYYSSQPEEPSWVENPAEGLDIWRGLLPLLWGGDAISKATGPEDLAPIGATAPGFVKPFVDQAYKTSLPVLVKWLTQQGPEVMHDAVKGLNRGHALYRARHNWPDASSVEPILDVFRRLMRYDR